MPTSKMARPSSVPRNEFSVELPPVYCAGEVWAGRPVLDAVAELLTTLKYVPARGRPSPAAAANWVMLKPMRAGMSAGGLMALKGAGIANPLG